MQILVVDDSPELRELIVRGLSGDGHQVQGAATLAEADASLRARPAELVVLDLSLPDGWGSQWCQRARKEGLAAFVLVLSAHSEVAQRLEGFEAGADDFLAKPFALAELRARVRALGRRRGASAATVLSHEDAEVDLAGRKATRGGAVAPLTAREWAVLESLARSRGRVLSREVLLAEHWEDPSEAAAASLEVLVGRIRKKLGNGWVRTVRGEGYALGF